MCTRDLTVEAFSPTCLWKVRMTNLNSKTIFISPNYVCGREKKAPYVLASLVGVKLGHRHGWG